MDICRASHAVEIDATLAAFDRLRGRAFAPLSTRTPREFAEAVMRMPDAHGATRPFSFGFAPYQLEPYAEIFNPRNQEVCMMMASRLGKSRIVLTALGFVIVEQPCRIGVMWPVEGDGKLWSKDDFMGELVDPTPEIAELIDNATGQRSAKNTLLHKHFPGGLMQIMGANAPGRARRMKARFLYADEIDAIVASVGDEGNMLDIFAKRGAEFPDCIQVYCSYPSVKGRSNIETKLLASDLRQWVVPCLLCGDELVLSRTGEDPFTDGIPRTRLIYEKERPQDARLVCPHCREHLTDAQRFAMVMGGDPDQPRFDLWKATRSFNGRAGFHANSLLWPHPVDPAKYPGGFLEILARKEIAIEASDNPERARRVLVNTDDAQTYESECDAKPEHTKLFLRREKYDPAKILPAGVLWIAFACDVQADRLELEIVGFGEKGHTWGLGYHVLKGTPMVATNEGVWAELERILTTTTFAHPSGRTLRIEAGLIDRGYKPDHVLAFTRPRAKRSIFASRGATSLCKPIVRAKPGWEGNPKTKVWELGTHEAKDIIYQRLDRDNRAADGFMHYPDLGCYSEQYFKALTAEDSDLQKAGDGKFYRHFHCEKGIRNEPLDLRVMALAIERIRKPKYAQLAAALSVEGTGLASGSDETNPNQLTKTPASKFQPRRFMGARKSNFVSGWKR